ncbi:MAG: LPS export ABC transporter ATP-binding protein [Candidatus Handelsmanbacteria bacterium RIFCSPLOWO2_12_FULL_64_10]|uniref:LPS export ABC transporter ATP-binding protein n=1 Tax=Handelsmanbacteria sp. (strain RIFCSPLOWO2_12_FULL_64_10) TaxID=1817868 RepID=A0A1F6C823_HANXR|nr:MAG: LPS export ABC transporter ATP-binding protein [Candidatus Handelsmanbacteria bacterium RIFCSPLOWO2_12_FULL_64_10]
MSLRAEGLTKQYGKRLVVKGVEVEVGPGEVVGLLGPNGAGKTTTFHMIVGLVKPTAGRIFLEDLEVTSMPMYRRARAGIGYLAQEPSAFRGLTVEENVRAVLEAQGAPPREQRERAEALLEELGMGHLARQRADLLSGGETRRVEIARALAVEPKFMLLDEPFAGVDPRTVEDIQGIIARLRSRGIGLLITDHRARETLAITDRAYIISDGELRTSGTARTLADDPEVRRIYLGEGFRM